MKTDTTDRYEINDVPLVAQLKSVPIKSRAIIHYGEFSSRNIPYGTFCHKAALEIERLMAEITALRSSQQK